MAARSNAKGNKIWNTPFKEKARDLAVKANGRAAGMALALPGPDLYDVAAALKSGLYNRQTRCIWAEVKEDLVPQIRKNSRRFRFRSRPVIHGGLLETLYLSGMLHGRKLDYAFLDWCSPLSEPRLMWLQEQLVPNLAPESVVVMTVQLSTRRNRFMPRLDKEVLGSGCKVYTRSLVRRLSAVAVSDHFGPTAVRIFAAIELSMRSCRLTLEDFFTYLGNPVGGTCMAIFRFHIERDAMSYCPSLLMKDRMLTVLKTSPDYWDKDRQSRAT